MKDQYEPQVIEQETQQFWDKHQTFLAREDSTKEKFYCVTMFPYPSGKLHMGHVRVYTIGDVISRYQRMLGKNVLQPMGWDAFGLPAENAAIQNKTAPAKWTDENIIVMRERFKSLGLAYDWSRELATCQPDYYRWEQWFFTELFKKGLVYKKNSLVNWDPIDQTVLANEQVIDGRGWRSNAIVERREIPQWFIKITAYAEELLDGLDTLTHWPQQIRTMQRNWINRSEGAVVYFDVENTTEKIEIFTTRVDTLMGVTYLAIAADHPLSIQAAKTNEAIQTFLTECRASSVAEAVIATQEKRGINTRLNAIHPVTGETIPIWIANFVLMEYGTGAVMSVPAHDQRDFEFAQKYQLPIKQVIAASNEENHDFSKGALTTFGTLINSGEFDQLTSQAALEEITQHLINLKKGKKEIHYRLRDWGVSRQRYWGTPIPIIYCEDCGAVPVPEKDLPVILPESVEFTGATSPLKTLASFYETTCPQCEKKATRETDTFDTFVESSWYYARYASFDQNKKMLDERVNYWTPVDQYVGGPEHAVMHLLYARFFHKLMRDAGLVNSDEPFDHLLTQGMVLKDGAKMSKSRGNTVDPKPLIDKYGADTVRLFMIFASPPEQALEWSDSGAEGAYRFLKRVWSFAYEQHESIIKANIAQRKNSDIMDSIRFTDQQSDARRQIHEILKQARYDFERQQFNTVVSGCMKLLNLLQTIETESDSEIIIHEGFSILLRLLAPIVPHITHVLWLQLEFSGDVIDAPWPHVNQEALKTDQINLVVQINGKLRGSVSVATEADEETIKTTVLNSPEIQHYLTDKTIRKIIVVRGKLVSIVI